MAIDESDTYVIPHNFTTGTVIGGETYRTRNVIEGLVLSVPPAVLTFLLGRELSFAVKLSIALSTALPLLILGVSGVGGDSLSKFVRIWLRYLRSRRTLLYNPRLKEEDEPVDLAKLQEEMILPRDRLLQLVEQLRSRAAKPSTGESAGILYFEEDIGIVPKPEEYKTPSEKRQDAAKRRKLQRRENALRRKQRRLEKKALKKASTARKAPKKGSPDRKAPGQGRAANKRK